MLRAAVVLAIFSTISGCNEKRPNPTGPSEGAPGAAATATEARAEEEGEKRPAPILGAFPAQVAGAFYPDGADELRGDIEGYLAAAKQSPQTGRDVVGILSPHAGYRYSGPIAGSAFAAVRSGDYRTVVIMALNHRRRAPKVGLLDRPAYDTPLGSARVDTAVVRELHRGHGDLFTVDESLFEGEHSLEVQIPFVQIALPGARIVPMIVAVDDLDLLGRAGAAMFDLLGRRRDVLFVASSDLSHHFPYEEARAMDGRNLALLEEWKIDEWIESASRSREGMCGVRPVLAFARMFERYPATARSVARLDARNSGDTAGDKASVVGYGALAFTVEEGMRDESGGKEFGPYGPKERRALMDLAKRAVAAAAKGEQAPDTSWARDALARKGAAFVTLKKNGDLRGCIGHVIARIPLVDCVADVARSAAIHDTRFSPVRPDELDDLAYEISVLTEPKPIEAEAVEVGVHGLIMSRGGRSGLLLPQVPVEWGWGREEFLAHTCRKAGLPLDCWKDPATEIKSFEAIVWGEEDLE